MKKLSSEIALLLQLIDESYEKNAWHGPNLKGSIRGLTAKQAAWRPSRGRHSIWEIVLHCAYWKYIVRRRIRGEKRGSFQHKGSNWFVRQTGLTEKAWREDVRLLDVCHHTMREALASLKRSELQRVPSGSKVSNAKIISGIASHDLYHAGQIQLLKRLMKS
jgi:uncharacterized damage-inducible protein DinB